MFRDRKSFEKYIGLVKLRFGLYVSDTKLVELLYIYIEASLYILYCWKQTLQLPTILTNYFVYDQCTFSSTAPAPDLLYLSVYLFVDEKLSTGISTLFFIL